MSYRPQEVRPTTVIKKLVLVESKQYKDQWLRNYEINVDHTHLSAIENIVGQTASMGSRSTIDGFLNTNLPDILKPSAMVSDRADIIHGWNEKRFKFVLIVEITIPNSNSILINYIQGYTEYLGISTGDHLDPAMKFYTNSVIKLRRTIDSRTGEMVTTPLGNFNVVNDETNKHPSNFDSLKLARPGDIAMNVASVKDLDEPNIVSMSNVGSINGVELVDKSSLLPTDHVAATIKTAMDSKMSMGMVGESGDVKDMMVGNLQTPSIYNIDFFKTILDIKAGNGNDFTIGDLKLIEPNLPHITETFMGTGLNNYNIPTELLTEDTAETYDSSIESRMSLVVHEGVSALLNETTLNNIVFEVDNYGGTPNGSVLDGGSYIDGLNIPVFANAFLSSFIHRVWGSLTNGNATLCKVLVMGMVESDTTVIITLDGRPPVTYRYPTFADSKFLPIIMDNKGLNDMSEGYSDIIDSTLGSLNNALSKQFRDSIMQPHGHHNGLVRA